MASFHDFTTAQLKQAVQIREQIESLQAKLDVLLGGVAPTKTKAKVGRDTGKRTLSAATKKKMAAAQQARWASIKGKASPTKPAPAKASLKKKVMSPEAKAKIAAAMKARWEAKKASGTAK